MQVDIYYSTVWNRKKKIAFLKNCSFKDFKSKIRKCIDTNYTMHKLYTYMYILHYFMALRAILLFQILIAALFVSKFYWYIFFVDFPNFTKINFLILIIHEPSLGSCKAPDKIWVQSGSVVLTLIGNKQTPK